MKLLKTTKEQDIFPDAILNPQIKYRLRKAARAVIFDKDDKICLLNVSKRHHHKLPGGKMEPGEDAIRALKREAKEETGCEIEIVKEIGRIREYRDRFSQISDSDCYLVQVKGKKGEPVFTASEKEKGFKLLWVDLDKAIDLLKNDKPISDEGKFIRVRDLEFLEKAKDLVCKSFPVVI